MKAVHLDLLVCPRTRKPLTLSNAIFGENDRIKEAVLVEVTSGNEYPIVNYIPRFVSSDNYAETFGYQWNQHLHTQQDSYSGVDVSKKRYVEETKWEQDLSGEVVLEAGSGAGRFTTPALDTGATIVSFDYSRAVEANYEINGNHPNLLLVQADIYNMPFPLEFFDRAFCFGVLQHTPDPHEAFNSLLRHVKPNGRIASDVYWKAARRFLHMKTWLRPFTKNQEPEQLYRFVCKYVDFIWPLVRVMRKTYLTQKMVSRIVADRSDYMQDADDSMLKEWAYLDTFDWLSPAYDNPQTLASYRSWHDSAGLIDIEVQRGWNGLEGRGTKAS